jgi:hypothetical protein
MDDIRQFKEWQRFFEGADVVDVKTIESRNELRTFVAASFSYHPWWMVMLYRIRTLIVCVLGLVKHEAPEQLPDLKPAQIPFAPGEKATFFTVRLAKEGHYWIAETPPDKHKSLCRHPGRTIDQRSEAVLYCYHCSLSALDRAGIF